jgi:glycosyltransferase involved in cell wall biosynthesis
MTIVHVISRLVPGGAENQLREVSSRSRLPSQIVELEWDERSRIGALRRLHAILGSRDAKVVVAWLDRSQIAVALTARRRQRLVAAIQGMPRRTGVAGWQLRASFSRFDGFASNSRISRDAIIRFARPFALPQFEVIPNGVTVPVQRSQQPGAVPRVGFIGRNDPAKGLDVLIRALDLLQSSNGLAFEAVLVGEGVPAAAATQRPGFRHETHGRVHDPWDRLGPVDLVVVPSRSEGSPNVVIEAFARRIPVVTTTAGGIPELAAEDRALMVAPDDAAALGNAIAGALQDPGASRDRSARAFDYENASHSWDRVVADWDELLEQELRHCA